MIFSTLHIFGIAVIILAVCGLYCILVTRNMIRVLVGVELLIKAVTLLIILAGYVTGNISLAQSIAITIIIIEVVVVVIVAGVILGIFKANDSLDVINIRNLKG